MAQLSSNKCFLCNKESGDLYCRDCERFLCKTCKPVHDLIPATQHHTVIDANQEGRLVFKPKPLCADHKKEYLYYCNKCDCLICSNCIISVHSGHPCCDYKTIVDQRRQNVKEIIGTLKEKVHVLEDSLNKVKNDKLPQIINSRDDFDKKVNAVTNEIGCTIDRVKNIHKTTASDYQSTETEKLTKIRINVERIQNEYKNVLSKFENVLLEQHGVTFLSEQNAIQIQLKNLDEIPDIPTPDHIPNFSADSFTNQIIDELQNKFTIRALKENEEEIRKLKDTVEKAEQYKLSCQDKMKQQTESLTQLEKDNDQLKQETERIVKENMDEKAQLRTELESERYHLQQMEKQISVLKTELDAEKGKFKEHSRRARANKIYTESCTQTEEKINTCTLSCSFSQRNSETDDEMKAGNNNANETSCSIKSDKVNLGVPVIAGKLEDCTICLSTPRNPRKLKCGHIFCEGCINQQFKFKPVCPNCGSIQGVITGDQPPGKMSVFTNAKLHLPGYADCGRIDISYEIFSGKQGPEHPKPGTQFEGIRRTAYLPDNTRGRKIAKMLEVAFNRKLIFTIGFSIITGKEGVVTWNDIHHKTNPNIDSKFGYPDPTYFDRVVEELAAKGITEKDIKIY